MTEHDIAYKYVHGLHDALTDSQEKKDMANDILKFAKEYHKQQLTLTDVVNCVYVVTERDNYGEQLFKGVFANREKALKYLDEDGFKEDNINEINEIELE